MADRDGVPAEVERHGVARQRQVDEGDVAGAVRPVVVSGDLLPVRRVAPADRPQRGGAAHEEPGAVQVLVARGDDQDAVLREDRLARDGIGGVAPDAACAGLESGEGRPHDGDHGVGVVDEALARREGGQHEPIPDAQDRRRELVKRRHDADGPADGEREGIFRRKARPGGRGGNGEDGGMRRAGLAGPIDGEVAGLREAAPRLDGLSVDRKRDAVGRSLLDRKAGDGERLDALAAGRGARGGHLEGSGERVVGNRKGNRCLEAPLVPDADARPVGRGAGESGRGQRLAGGDRPGKGLRARERQRRLRGERGIGRNVERQEGGGRTGAPVRDDADEGQRRETARIERCAPRGRQRFERPELDDGRGPRLVRAVLADDAGVVGRVGREAVHVQRLRADAGESRKGLRPENRREVARRRELQLGRDGVRAGAQPVAGRDERRVGVGDVRRRESEGRAFLREVVDLPPLDVRNGDAVRAGRAGEPERDERRVSGARHRALHGGGVARGRVRHDRGRRPDGRIVSAVARAVEGRERRGAVGNAGERRRDDKIVPRCGHVLDLEEGRLGVDDA